MSDLEKNSLKTMIALYDERRANIVQFSGGKDSIVLKDLARKSGLNFSYSYQNTTIDPPGHIGWIRKNYPDVVINQPRYTFYELIAKYGLPTRQNRFCCQHLKEYIGKGAKTFEGLRIDESKEEELSFGNRGKSSKRTSKRGRRLSALKEPEMCDTRIKDKIHVYPIMHWTSKEVWEYIHKNNLPYPDFYDKGFHRLGCIGCPLGQQPQRIREYKMFPRFVYATIIGINNNIIAGKSISKHFSDPYEAFYWWISELSIKEHKEQSLFSIDYETFIRKTFPTNGISAKTMQDGTIAEWVKSNTK
jgi:phosphoadenosine phosphosulfate reductase